MNLDFNKSYNSNTKNENLINIGLFGSPNSGKSTLFNALLNNHIAIVSDKPQTTEKITDGLFSIENLSIKLIDTPGISFIKQSGTRGELNKLSWEVLDSVNYPFFLVPANKPYIQQEFLDKNKDFVVIITKIDMIKKANIPLVIERINDLYKPKDILCVSAKYDIGMDKLLNYFLSLEKRKNMTPQEELILNNTFIVENPIINNSFTSLSNKELALDMTREAIFVTLHGEVPYRINISNIEWNETFNGIQIQQHLLVPNNHYKLILYGNNNLNTIQKYSIIRLKKLLKKEVSLKLIVKVLKR